MQFIPPVIYTCIPWSRGTFSATLKLSAKPWKDTHEWFLWIQYTSKWTICRKQLQTEHASSHGLAYKGYSILFQHLNSENISHMCLMYLCEATLPLQQLSAEISRVRGFNIVPWLWIKSKANDRLVSEVRVVVCHVTMPTPQSELDPSDTSIERVTFHLHNNKY